MRRFDAVLLDVDGTLVDSNDQHAHAWVETLAEFDVEVSYDRVRQMIGMGGDRLVEAVAGHDKDGKTNARIGARRSEVFRERWLGRVRPLAGARELVLRFREEGLEYAIATAAKEDELALLLEAGGIADLCARRTTSSDVEETKPDPEIVDAALQRVSAERSRVVMIGDTPYDVEAARGAGVAIIGVTSGGWTRKQLTGATAVFEGPGDILAGWATGPFGAK